MIDDPHTTLIMLQLHMPIVQKRPTTFAATQIPIDLV